MKSEDMSVALVDVMGNDLSVVNAARVSFAKQSTYDVIGHKESYDDYGNCVERQPIRQLKEADKKLIRYLAEHNHWSPFAHAMLSFRIKAPIFVARQLVKHQVGLTWNEVSRRYVDTEPSYYIPEVWRERADNVKQGSGSDGVRDGHLVSSAVDIAVGDMNNLYKRLLSYGVCPEQARMVLPQNTHTEWIWTGSLYAFARVCQLRLDQHAQKETQEVAQMLSEKCSQRFPYSWEVLMKGVGNESA